MKSNGQAEMRRNYEELVNALRMLEEENKRLRALLEKYEGKKLVEVRVEEISERQMTGTGAGPAGAKTAKRAGLQGPASSGPSAGRPGDDAPRPGQFVEYTPPGGKRGRVPKTAVVLEVKPGGRLRLKVCHVACPDEVVDDVGPERWRAR
jgi:hypothetical protein